MKIKSLWRGVFAFNCGLIIEYAHAYTIDQAKVVMARRLAKKQGVTNQFMLTHLKTHRDTYNIKLEIEWLEDDEKSNSA